jgi:hypothetical protein
MKTKSQQEETHN